MYNILIKIIAMHLTFFFANQNIAQYPINEELMRSAVQIETVNGSGSAFFYNDDEGLFLVTALHVLTNSAQIKGDLKSLKLISSKIEIYFYPRDHQTDDHLSMKCDLEYLYNNNLIRFSLVDDIIIAKLGVVETTNFTLIRYNASIEKSSRLNSILTPFTSELVGTYKNAKLGHDVFIIGYPKSLGLSSHYQYDFNRPISRKGIVAGKSEINQTLIIDCPAYGGNSGGPVIERDRDKVKLIGLVSSFIPLAKIWPNKKDNIEVVNYENSGFTVVQPMDKILKLIDSMQGY